MTSETELGTEDELIERLENAASLIKGVTDDYDVPDDAGIELGKAYSKVWKAKAELEGE